MFPVTKSHNNCWFVIIISSRERLARFHCVTVQLYPLGQEERGRLFLRGVSHASRTGPCHRAGVGTGRDSITSFILVYCSKSATRFSRTAIRLSFSSLRSRKAFTSSTKSEMDFCWSRIAEVSPKRKSNDFPISSKSSKAGFFFGPILATGRSFSGQVRADACLAKSVCLKYLCVCCDCHNSIISNLTLIWDGE